MLLNRHTHEKLSLARAEPPSTERQEPFLLVYPKWLELPMADCAMQAELLLDWLGEITMPRLPSKPCNRCAHVRSSEQLLLQRQQALASTRSCDGAEHSFCISARGGCSLQHSILAKLQALATSGRQMKFQTVTCRGHTNH